jgi:hypothetical protein
VPVGIGFFGLKRINLHRKYDYPALAVAVLTRLGALVVIADQGSACADHPMVASAAASGNILK